MHSPKHRVALILCALALFQVGCGGGDEPPASDADLTTEPSTGAETPAGAGDQLFDTAFAQVCRETGQPQAAEYVAGPGVHPILVMQSRDGTEYMGTSTTLPAGWGVQWPELGRTELVACAQQVSATPVEVCEGYSDDDTGVEWTVQTHDVVYEYTVRVARTAEVLGRSTFEVPAGSCPMFSSYTDGDPQPVPYYPSVGDGEVELFFRPFVTGS